jgi:hypothetical protein
VTGEDNGKASSMKNITSARIKRFFKKIFNGQIFVVLFPVWSFFILQKRYQAYVKKLATKNLPLVLRIEYGGLGDHLVYSALPEAVFKKYGVKTQISLRSIFSSDEVKNFAWGSNPYVSFSPEKGRTVSIPNFGRYKNYNEIVLALFGLDGPLFRAYYKPSARPEVADKIVCDLTSGKSKAYNESGTREFWDVTVKYLNDNFKKEDLLLLNPTSPYPDKRMMDYIKEKMGIETISTGSIEELTDLLCSAKGRVLLDSGAKSVAAAYGKPSVVLVRGFTNMHFSYPENKYIRL